MRICCDFELFVGGFQWNQAIRPTTSLRLAIAGSFSVCGVAPIVGSEDGKGSDFDKVFGHCMSHVPL